MTRERSGRRENGKRGGKEKEIDLEERKERQRGEREKFARVKEQERSDCLVMTTSVP